MCIDEFKIKSFHFLYRKNLIVIDSNTVHNYD